MDFANAKLPELTPLVKSAGQSNFDYENQLRNLFVELFNTSLAGDVFDANVLGAAQLGSLNLVRKAVNYDGLVLLDGDREEAATRYVYKAWKSRNNQGRGLHFLRTYLQMLFPNANSVEQLAQPKSSVYPSNLIPWKNANEADYFLTSRLMIEVNYDVATWGELDRMIPIIMNVIAARFVLQFRKLLLLDVADVFIGCVAITGATVTIYPDNFSNG